MSVGLGVNAGAKVQMSDSGEQVPLDELTADHTIAQIPALPDGWQAYRYSILRDGKIGILAVDRDLRGEWRFGEGGELLGDPYGVAKSSRAQFYTFDGFQIQTGPRFSLNEPFAIFDQFADGRWLIATPRSQRGPNARVISQGGDLLAELQIGDGIEHLKIDDNDLIWVGWFDEGVFGNDDWKIEGHEWSPSSYGLAAFDLSGSLVTYAKGPPDNDHIADCYALNVTHDKAWACTYTGFPILSCDASLGSRWWRTTLSGIKAIAVRPPYLLATGGYAGAINRCVLVKLDDAEAAVVSERRLPFDETQLREAELFDGRGNAIHVVFNGKWHTWSVEDFIGSDRSA